MDTIFRNQEQVQIQPVPRELLAVPKPDRDDMLTHCRMTREWAEERKNDLIMVPRTNISEKSDAIGNARRSLWRDGREREYTEQGLIVEQAYADYTGQEADLEVHPRGNFGPDFGNGNTVKSTQGIGSMFLGAIQAQGSSRRRTPDAMNYLDHGRSGNVVVGFPNGPVVVFLGEFPQAWWPVLCRLRGGFKHRESKVYIYWMDVVKMAEEEGYDLSISRR